MLICPNCGFFYEEGDHFCSICGTQLTEPEAPVSKRKHTVWPPVLIMVIMAMIGFAVYFLTGPKVTPPVNTAEYPWFHIENGVLSFTEEAYTGGPELIVPDTVDGQTVTALSEGCFADCNTLISVTLPDSLVEIRGSAFRNCSSIRGVFIPANVTFLGEEAFAHCQDLESICFESIPVHIQSGAFESCQSLRFIFFSATYPEWHLLYDDFINPYVYVICEDGVFPQGGQIQ